jgi:iron complex outermembrane recepter protein
MYCKLFFIALLFPVFNCFNQTNTGCIQGTIISFTDEPLIGVNVGLQNTAFTSATNKDGQFILKDVPAGTYTIVASSVGYSANKQNVVVEAGKTINLNLQLSENNQELRDVVVTALRNNYKPNSTSLATRTDAPLIETPQSAQILPQRILKDKQAFTLNEITPVLTGVKANNGMGAFTLRGFTGYNHFDGGFITYNGIRGNLYVWSQQPLLYNIERVEVLRGPASVLFSEGIPGGIINFVTKKPQVDNRYEFTVSAGSWNMVRLSADATGALSKNKKLLYRLIAGADRSNSFRDQQKIENYFIAPSLTYQFSKRTSLNLEINYAYQEAVHQYDRGTFIKPLPDGKFDFNYYPNNLTVQSPTDFGRTNNASATLHFIHRVNDKLSFNVVQRHVRSLLNFSDHGVVGAIRNDSISRSYQIWDYDQFNWQTTAYANYHFKTGFIKHSVLAGVDYNSYGWHKNDYRNSPSKRISILNPDYNNDVPAPNAAVDYYDDNKQSNTVIGGYLQDQISLSQQFKILLSLRYDDYKLKQTPLSDKDDLQGDESEATSWTPRIGVVYLPVKNISFYGSYNRSFNPQRSNSAGSGGPFPPRLATQYEVGYKGDFFNNALSTMVALYDIKYTHILAADPTPTSPNRQVLVDGTRSKGFEITLQGNIKDLSIIAGYAYNDHVLSSDNTIGKKGYRYINAPRNIGNVWLKYNFSKTVLKGLGIGIGGRYTSNQVGNLATQNFLIPESTVLDAVANYEIKRFNFQFNLNNIANERYFQGGVSRVTIASLGNPRNFRVGVGYTIR